MALYWNTKKVRDRDRKIAESPSFPESLALAAMNIGLGNITEENLAEWVYRLNRYTWERGPLLVNPDRTAIIWTQDMLRPWIGLETNVATWTNAGFDEYMRKLSHR